VVGKGDLQKGRGKSLVFIHYLEKKKGGIKKKGGRGKRFIEGERKGGGTPL